MEIESIGQEPLALPTKKYPGTVSLLNYITDSLCGANNTIIPKSVKDTTKKEKYRAVLW